MKEITVKIYQYSELSEKAQEIARQWYLECFDSSFCWENTQYDASEIGLIIESLEDHRPNKGYFKGTASDCANKILIEHGESTETYKTAKDFLQKTVAILSCKTPEMEDSELENMQEELEKEFLHSLLEDYRIMLNREIEYQQSEDCIAEAMQANEYDFLENGKRY